MNRVELIGGLTKGVDFRFVGEKNIPKAVIQLAVNGTRYSSKDRAQIVTTTWVTCEAWGGMASQLADEDPKVGERIYVLGELDQNTYEDSQGNKKSSTRIRIHFYRRLDPRDAEGPLPSQNDEAPY